MRSSNAITLIRSVVAAILVILGVGALTSGRLAMGVLLVGLAACNIALTVTIRRRRAAFVRRFPNVAARPSRPGGFSA